MNELKEMVLKMAAVAALFAFARILADAGLSSAIWFLLTGPLETFTPDLVSCPAYNANRRPNGRRFMFNILNLHDYYGISTVTLKKL